MIKQFLLLTLFLFLAGNSVAQDRIPGQIIIQIDPDFDKDRVLNTIFDHVKKVEELSAPWRIYLLYFDEGTELEATFLDKLVKMPGIAAAQWNHSVALRTKTPNDSEWFRQKDMGLINMQKAWDYSTGGRTPQGDTIVVAVFESGIYKQHPDLTPNFYHNRGEIPDNQMDDDANGYTDDFNGWDAGPGGGDGNGFVPEMGHGTAVCGIIGAKGNNEFAVTGVNWDVKILPVVNVKTEAQIVKAYNYAGMLRRKYNMSGGAEGAFVVATNASFGKDFIRPDNEQFDLWCPLFDSLGVLGILSVAATTNQDADVDALGDMPTNCTSEYLIAVTEIAVSSGERAPAGYGSISVDLGAPGDGTITTIRPDIIAGDTTWTGNFPGTSAAAPHVAGAVAWLYSLPCDSFVLDARNRPIDCARRVKSALLRNVAPEPTLAGITTTGGRLDVYAAAKDIMDHCSGTVGTLALKDVRPNPVRHTLEIRYQTPDYNQYQLTVYNMMGQMIYNESFSPPTFQGKITFIDVNEWAAGMYLLSLSNARESVVKKIIKL